MDYGTLKKGRYIYHDFLYSVINNILFNKVLKFTFFNVDLWNNLRMH